MDLIKNNVMQPGKEKCESFGDVNKQLLYTYLTVNIRPALLYFHQDASAQHMIGFFASQQLGMLCFLLFGLVMGNYHDPLFFLSF